MEKKLTIKQMYALLKKGKVKLRPLRDIIGMKKNVPGYNGNYIRDWFKF